ncbi:mitochondrial sodium/calcium exchanger protein [Sphaerodactylus townsendi]|uniref:mitochondrial sodium/calcium exchanger protein n=1 Tax=Sphaerodactylus townsendi TaxID=933632 RepID=UPI002025D0BA|nr:mitochondrial sodium/calcium exchanger protein [Sphaerodactylus townsendi]XP_048369639.1 mitochondrial sodium/calcium exchanger protein [Sphaerodactylus townsendi]XP_048369640.1 mitochondrial sodium/calcium exchanger protein [Sphaerodactylus townsendi]
MWTFWVFGVAWMLVGQVRADRAFIGPWEPMTPAPLCLEITEQPNNTQYSGRSVDCREVKKQNVSERCSFIRSNPDCRMDGGFLNYLNGIFCVFPADLQPVAVTLYILWLFYLFLILGVTAEKFFCPNLSAISTKLKLAHNVAGVTFLAFGNGAPDVFSAVVAFSDPRTAGLAIGALFGAGIFVTTIVAGGIAMVRPFTTASRPFLRDAIFYMVAVFLTFVALYFEQVTLAEALSYIGLYVFYVLTVVVSTWLHKRQHRERLLPSTPAEPELPRDSEDGDSSSFNGGDYREEYQPLLPSEESTLQILTHSMNPLDYRKWRRKPCYWRVLKVFKLPVEVLLLLTVPVVDPDREDQNWKRPLNCLHLVTAPLICIITLKSGEYGFHKIQDVFPVWGVVALAGALLAVIVFCTTKNEEPPRYHIVFAFLGFLVSAMWINAAATEVVNILRTLGVIFRLSNTVLGLTLLAWGNSIGDTFSDLTMARQGYPRMAFSACFGGIIFNMLVGVGLGCLLQMTNTKLVVKLEPDSLLVWILAGALGLSLVFSFIAVPAQCFRLSRGYGCCLIVYYLAFLTVALLTEFKVIRLSTFS